MHTFTRLIKMIKQKFVFIGNHKQKLPVKPEQIIVK